ncbi:hypothetical protein LZ30DRAFT_771583 [Colletotrichum cereale]|nr:hypothetical protein LZ30DRAFT_771583 [Colletotrichum cereale]
MSEPGLWICEQPAALSLPLLSASVYTSSCSGELVVTSCIFVRGFVASGRNAGVALLEKPRQRDIHLGIRSWFEALLMDPAQGIRTKVLELRVGLQDTRYQHATSGWSMTSPVVKAALSTVEDAV